MPATPPPALFYKSDGFSAARAGVMGRHVAGESFFRAFVERHRGTALWAEIEAKADAEDYRAALRRYGNLETPVLVARNELQRLQAPGLVFYPEPYLADHSWRRAVFGGRRWSICGINHTTSSASAMDALADLVTAPLHPWDAVICTSQAVKQNILAVIDAQQEYLRARVGASRFDMPQLPVIPLGVHAADFRFSPEERAAARTELGLDDDAIAVLYVGRLSFHAKANPFPLYTALEQAVRDLPPGKRVVLVEYGQFSNPAIAEAFDHAAKSLCPSVRRVVLDGQDQPLARRAWAAADIFSSLADNIQEAFGITPVEAMAAGLPVVVSDWNGYKESVRHGVDGFRVPTLMPAAGAGTMLAGRHMFGLDSADRYSGYVSATVSVDIRATAAAFGQLFRSPELRRKMGAAGQERVATTYDWPLILDRYEALWRELTSIREHAPEVAGMLPPARQDPFRIFANYPTASIAADTRVQLAKGMDETIVDLAAAERLLIVNFAATVLPTRTELESMLLACGTDAVPAQTLIEAVPAERRSEAWLGVAWLLKVGLLRSEAA